MEISNTQITAAFRPYNFGILYDNPKTQRRYLAESIFKLECNYGVGRSMMTIIREFNMLSGHHIPRPTMEALRWAFAELIGG